MLILLVVGVGSGLLHSFYSACSKWVVGRQQVPPLVFLLWVNLCVAVLSVLLWLVVAPMLPPVVAWPWLLAAATTCALAYAFLYCALSTGDVSSVMPLMGSKVLFSAMLAPLLLQEPTSWRVLVAALLVVVSTAALSYSPSELRSSAFHFKPVMLMLTSCLIFSVTDVLIQRTLAHLDSTNFLVWYNILVAMIGIPMVLPLVRRRKLPVQIHGSSFLLIVAAAAFLVLATLCFVICFGLSNSIVIPNILMSTRGVFIVLLSLLLPRMGWMALDTQSGHVYAWRLAASLLIFLSVFVALV